MQSPSTYCRSDDRAAKQSAGDIDNRSLVRTFKLPKFDGEDYAELFIQKFKDVTFENEWAERKWFLHLWCYLDEPVKAYIRVENTDVVLQALQLRYGVLVRQAKERLTKIKNYTQRSRNI